MELVTGSVVPTQVPTIVAQWWYNSGQAGDRNPYIKDDWDAWGRAGITQRNVCSNVHGAGIREKEWEKE